jgi:hypothetical protein
MSEYTAAANALAIRLGDEKIDQVATLVTRLLEVTRAKLREVTAPTTTALLGAAQDLSSLSVNDVGAEVLGWVDVPLQPPIVLPKLPPNSGADAALSAIEQFVKATAAAQYAAQSIALVERYRTEIAARLQAGITPIINAPTAALDDLESFLLDSLDGFQFGSSEPEPRVSWYSLLAQKVTALA